MSSEIFFCRKNLLLLGGTETTATLLKAEVKILMLTGDKQQNAINYK
jgi:hypothetical protein